VTIVGAKLIMECTMESDRTTLSVPNREIVCGIGNTGNAAELPLTDMTGFNFVPARQNPTECAGFRSLLALLIGLLSDTPW